MNSSSLVRVTLWSVILVEEAWQQIIHCLFEDNDYNVLMKAVRYFWLDASSVRYKTVIDEASQRCTLTFSLESVGEYTLLANPRIHSRSVQSTIQTFHWLESPNHHGRLSRWSDYLRSRQTAQARSSESKVCESPKLLLWQLGRGSCLGYGVHAPQEVSPRHLPNFLTKDFLFPRCSWSKSSLFLKSHEGGLANLSEFSLDNYEAWIEAVCW